MRPREALAEPLPEVFRFKPGPLTVRIEPLLRVHGYKQPELVRPDVRAVARKTVAIAEALFRPCVVYQRVGVEASARGWIRLDTGATLHCEAFGRHMPDPRSLIVSVLTMGQAIDKQVGAWLEKEDVLEALFIETAAWLAIESVTKDFAAYLRKLVSAEGLRLSRRMAPGYSYSLESGRCEWPLEEQKHLFDLFCPAQLPVQLLDSFVMLPKLSRTAVYGLSPAY